MDRCLYIKGRVQGVGFRYWTVLKAYSIGGLSGYAYNMENGDVVVLMSGPEDKMNELQTSLYKGPLFSRVDSVEERPDLKSIFPPIIEGSFKRI